MEEDKQVVIGIAEKYGVAEGPNGHIALIFESGGKACGSLLNETDANNLVAKIIEISGLRAPKQMQAQPRHEHLTVYPIPVSALGVARGRTDTEALLSVRVGTLTLTFSTEPATLLDMCEAVRVNTKVTAPQRPN